MAYQINVIGFFFVGSRIRNNDILLVFSLVEDHFHILHFGQIFLIIDLRKICFELPLLDTFDLVDYFEIFDFPQISIF